jgi:hypothetical protein
MDSLYIGSNYIAFCWSSRISRGCSSQRKLKNDGQFFEPRHFSTIQMALNTLSLYTRTRKNRVYKSCRTCGYYTTFHAGHDLSASRAVLKHNQQLNRAAMLSLWTRTHDSAFRLLLPRLRRPPRQLRPIISQFG